ncbi:MAG: PilZ domain-containing protein [Acidobacteriia bacterium]|nr:PilZ domain-containing protein [Terriglobia bacterium]
MTPSTRRQARILAGDRRINQRYPIQADLEYRIIQKGEVVLAGAGRSVDVSTGGILFEAPADLTLGAELEISLAWPARLHDSVAINLCVSGKVTRSDGARHAATIEEHEFYLRGRHRSPSPRFRAAANPPEFRISL